MKGNPLVIGSHENGPTDLAHFSFSVRNKVKVFMERQIESGLGICAAHARILRFTKEIKVFLYFINCCHWLHFMGCKL